MRLALIFVLFASLTGRACAYETTFVYESPTTYADGTPIAEPLTYNLYEDGLLAQTGDDTTQVRTNTTLGSFIVWVTAVSHRGVESEPSNAVTNNLLQPNRPDTLRISWP